MFKGTGASTGLPEVAVPFFVLLSARTFLFRRVECSRVSHSNSMASP